MLVQSCLDAFLAAIVEVKDSLAPLPESCCAAASRLGLRAARPQRPYRLIVRFCPSAHVPFVFLYIYTAGIARGELTLCSATLPHNYVST